MSSPPPKGWQEQVQQGLGEGEVIGETKSRYYTLLLAVYAFAESKKVPFTIVMMDILEDFCAKRGIDPEG